ncbi:MAG: FAD-binding oxidoreductase [Gammaproteobacteria bacterium]|nr:FAD-binding oxidoreductase [Gammaproteobacteria bacterium]NIR82623.1 FAD-binding oxidoreductase [Gammaproteobacteria bacterium]NIR89086.1 FAD-binding oxidoreductase [Gammaproteobacteria bacterium]NIU03857.1 FAD-binding oxidoreductase [Gammaproteobacteria bacterium]NIV74233.1 FAD-dependent oxidoreductase [Gammaproteobacteria bacterium]
MKPEHLNVTVVGAGIVGVATALYLQRDGHSVTILDPNGPGEGCSRGNAGILALDSVTPLARFGLIRELPAMLGDRLAPMRLNAHALFELLPWLLRFALAARPRRVAASASALAALLRTALDAYRPLLDAAGARELVRENGWLAVYETERAFARAAPERMLQRRCGVQMETLPVDEARRLVPALAPHIRHALLFPKVAHTLDPYRLVQTLAEHFAARGGRIERDRVVDIEAPAGGGVHLRTEAGSRDIPCLVIAAGAASGELARRLGHRVPLVAERGYHVMLPRPGVEMSMPVLAAEHAYVATPMAEGLRVAGTSELAGAGAPPHYERARVLMERGRRLLPGLRTEEHEEWMGERPTLPDSLPVIGPSPRVPSVYFAFGHQHLGLTLAAVTGRLVADMVSGRPTDVDMRPYRIDRF